MIKRIRVVLMVVALSLLTASIIAAIVGRFDIATYLFLVSSCFAYAYNDLRERYPGNKKAKSLYSDEILIGDLPVTAKINYEPDELIEYFQAGYIVALKNFVGKRHNHFEDITYNMIKEIEADLLAINKLDIITEKRLQFSLDCYNERSQLYRIKIVNLDTKVEWTGKEYIEENINQ